MIHLFFNGPWDKILRQKQILCKILNPVVKVTTRTGYIDPNQESDGICDACFNIYREGMIVWKEPTKKEKKK